MGANDAIPFPSRAKAWRMQFCIRDTSGAIITGWTGASMVLYRDGVVYGSAPTPTEFGSSGLGYVDFNSTVMDVQSLVGYCTVTNVGAVPFAFTIHTHDTRETTVLDKTRIDHMITGVGRRMFNKQAAGQGIGLAVYDDAGLDVLWEATETWVSNPRSVERTALE